MSRCPDCSYQDTAVLDSRPREEGQIVFRRRRCKECGHRFNTYESTDLLRLDAVEVARSRAIDDARRSLQAGLRVLDELEQTPIGSLPTAKEKADV